MDLGLIVLLILINGLFAMSEMAVVSSRKARLQRLADEGRPGAETALHLQEDPSRFLSTVQVGITSVGILSGAVGESALTDPLQTWLDNVPLLAPYAHGLALAITVVLLTYFSVVVGELVPKRLALFGPETIAAVVSRPMSLLSRAASPLVTLLSVSSGLLLKLFGARHGAEPPVTDEEIKVLMEQGAEAGVFHESEGELVSNVLRLDEQRIGAIMTPRKQVFHIDLLDDAEEIRRQVAQSPYSRVVVCRDGLDHVVGVLQRRDLLKPALEGQPFDIGQCTRPPLYIPDTVSTTHLLESFRKARTAFAVIVDEYGEMQGIVTLNDVLSAIVGDIPSEGVDHDPDVVQREDGSWLVDGGVAIERFKSLLDLDEDLPGEPENAYHTLGGFLMYCLERVPTVADHCDYGGWRFEVVDMDGNRVDKVLVMPDIPSEGSSGGDGAPPAAES